MPGGQIMQLRAPNDGQGPRKSARGAGVKTCNNQGCDFGRSGREYPIGMGRCFCKMLSDANDTEGGLEAKDAAKVAVLKNIESAEYPPPTFVLDNNNPSFLIIRCFFDTYLPQCACVGSETLQTLCVWAQP